MAASAAAADSYSWDHLGSMFEFSPDYLNRAGGMVSRPAFGSLLIIKLAGVLHLYDAGARERALQPGEDLVRSEGGVAHGNPEWECRKSIGQRDSQRAAARGGSARYFRQAKATDTGWWRYRSHLGLSPIHR